tara:strand:+ start:853 stop:1458 length:606 start_codon:yes stop_codon:yes gene_type:complete
MNHSLRKLYDWILNWSKSPYGLVALFILAFSESIFFPIPPDILLIALAIGYQSKAYRFALICTLGSLLGAIFGYYIGNYLWYGSYGIAEFFYNNISSFTEESFNNIKEYYNDFGFLIIITAGFTPIPYKLITISAGAFKIPFSLFILASTLSRSARFFLISFLIKKYGEAIKNYIEKYFNILSIAFICLIVFIYLFINKFI